MIMSIKRLEFSHKTVFGIVMRHSELCRKTLERILDKKILRVEIPEIEKTYDYSAYSRGIRLDVYCDGEDEVYNIEMQNYKFKDLPKRGRYYQAMIDKDLLDKGESYSNLKKNIIIFICRFDLFKKGKHLYTFENRCIQHPELAYGDETQKIILNTTSKENDIPLALKMFLDYIETGEVQDEFTAELEMEVDKIRQNKKWRDEIMTYEQEWENEKDSLCRQWKEEGREEGLTTGREEGLDLGLNQAYIKYASKMLENGSTRADVIASLVDMFEISAEKAEEVVTTASTK